jgi:hypothetical protein
MSDLTDVFPSPDVGEMGHPDDSVQPSSYLNDTDAESARAIPVMHPTIHTSAPSPGDPMDVTSPDIASMGPPAGVSPDPEANGAHEHMGGAEERSHTPSMPTPNVATAAQAGAQQPKVVQTAFIHKLYKYVLRAEMNGWKS